MNNYQATHRLLFLLLVPLLVLWFGVFLGNRPFATPDEGRYVEIPREMVKTGDYITPRLNGVKYFEKPPLLYWIEAANLKMFGLHEGTMRLSIVLFAMIGCIAIYLFGRRFYSPQAGLAACLILAMSPLYYALSRLIILDMPVTILTSLSLFTFLLTVHEPPGLNRRLWAWAFYALSALGVLTKGLMVLAISGPVILIWAISTHRWKDLWPAYLPSGIILFFAIVAPWHILAQINNPEFLYKYFFVEHFLRYTSSIHMRSQPFYFFVPVLLLGLFPWISLLWNSIKDGIKFSESKEQRGITLFMAIWAGWTFGFFSVSNSKLVPYILPCFPPLALILGMYWAKLWQSGKEIAARKEIRTFSIGTLIFGILGLIILWKFPTLLDHKPYLMWDFKLLMSILMSLGLIGLFATFRRYQELGLSLMPTAAIIIILSVIRLMPELQRPSIKPLAQVIQVLKKPGDIVGSYKSYYQDLPVYTNQVVTVVDSQGELEFGCEVEDCKQWMIDEKKFLELWNSDRRVFIVARIKEIDDLRQRVPTFSYHPLRFADNNILLVNKVEDHTDGIQP
jgi:4-amino-4-deoxy-L-arabinose transferase-like glycosyltransferase